MDNTLFYFFALKDLSILTSATCKITYNDTKHNAPRLHTTTKKCTSPIKKLAATYIYSDGRR